MTGKDPEFLGRPSPSLRKMRRMTRDELAEHIRNLQAEADMVRDKIARLKELGTATPKKITQLNGAHRRLISLADEGRRLYTVAAE